MVWAILLFVASMGFAVYTSKHVNKEKEKQQQFELEKKRLEAEREKARAEARKTQVTINANSGVNEKLRMAQVKCVQCGASIEEGNRFCKHCGTQVPDDVFRAEVKIVNDLSPEEAKRQHKLDKIDAMNERIRLKNEKIKADAERKAAEAKEKAARVQLREERTNRILLIAIGAGLGLLLIGILISKFTGKQ